MKKSAKILAFVLSLIMVLSVASAFAINASAETSPSLNVKETSREGNKVTVAVDLTDGTFNALDFQFNTSDGVKCESINPSGNVMGVGNKENGSVSAITTSTLSPGTVITATFTVPEDKDYSITGSVSNCAVTTTNASGEIVNNSVKPNVSGGVEGKAGEKPTQAPTEKSTDAPKPTEKTTAKTTKKTTAKTTKKTAKTTTRKYTTTRRYTTARTNRIYTTSLPRTTTDPNSTTSSLFDDPTTFEAITDDIFEEEDYPTYYEDEASEDGSDTEDAEEEEPINVKLIAAIAGGALVLVGGAVAAIIITNRKKNNESEFDDDDDDE